MEFKMEKNNDKALLWNANLELKMFFLLLLLLLMNEHHILYTFVVVAAVREGPGKMRYYLLAMKRLH